MFRNLKIWFVISYLFEPVTGSLWQSTDHSFSAGLTRTIPKAWTPNSGANETDQELLWDETSYDRGQIALADDYAKEMGLPRAQRFPWDQSKGIYLINAYHNIHCVVSQSSEDLVEGS